MKSYDHKKIESKWQKEWEAKKIYSASNDTKKKKFYGLIEFPYPSGDGLHVGHPRPYIGMDIISRKRRMEGFNVLYPIGWDAFGLPTENYAIKTGKDPRVVTKKNSDNFRKQIQSIGISFDWAREINTTDPKYYKWTQWIFLKFLEKGLAYKAKININWCPKDKIGLANEEVIDGKCERCGTLCEKREKEQWMLAITKYAERLDKDLDTVDYLERIKTQQRNWIGKSEGSEIDFKIIADGGFSRSSGRPHNNLKEERAQPDAQKSTIGSIKIFTTRADTLFGATYMVLAPEHELVNKLKSQITNWEEVESYKNEVKNKTEIERTDADKAKTGVELKGIKTVNPANNEEIPVFIADYVLATYGTGAIMAVPAHDDRDYAFAKKFGLSIKRVIEPLFIKRGGTDGLKENLSLVERTAVVCVIEHWSEKKVLCLAWKANNWKGFVVGGIEKSEDAIVAGIRESREETGYQNLEFIKKLEYKIHSQFYHEIKKQNRYAHFEVLHFKLKDGEHKELTEEENKLHNVVWVENDKVDSYVSTDEDMQFIWQAIGTQKPYAEEGILVNSDKFNSFNSGEAGKKITEAVGGKIVTKFKLRDWVFSRQRYWGEPIPVVHCDKCGIVPVPEKDLPVELPKVKDYQPTDSGESPLALITKWVNTKCPKCDGKAKRETDTMPNWAGSSWYYLRYADTKNDKEFASAENLKYWTPVDWYNGGMEHTTLHLLYSRFWHKFLYDLKLVPTIEPYMKRTSHGLIMGEGGVKMSKSIGNVVNPDSIVKTYGADTLRVYEMFMGPFEEPVAWSTESIIGPRRFIEKVWRIGQNLSKENNSLSSITKILHKTIKKVSLDVEAMRFNTAVSAMMILATEMEKLPSVNKEDYKKFLQILAPFAPHVTEELWSLLGEKKSINKSVWPIWDENLIKDEEVKIVIQVNGKVRGELMVRPNEDEEEVKKKALKEESVLKYVSLDNIKKTIYVKGRLFNIVV